MFALFANVENSVNGTDGSICFYAKGFRVCFSMTRRVTNSFCCKICRQGASCFFCDRSKDENLVFPWITELSL